MGTLRHRDLSDAGGTRRRYFHECPHGSGELDELDVLLIAPPDQPPPDWERVATLAAVAKFRAYYRLRGCGCEVQEEA